MAVAERPIVHGPNCLIGDCDFSSARGALWCREDRDLYWGPYGKLASSRTRSSSQAWSTEWMGNAFGPSWRKAAMDLVATAALVRHAHPHLGGRYPRLDMAVIVRVAARRQMKVRFLT